MEIPSNVSIITQPGQSQKLIRKVLCDTRPSCMPLIFKLGGLPRRQISLIGLEYNGQYLIFDLRSCPNIVLEGHLYRLLISPDIVKAIHCGGQELLKLSSKHNIITRCLFDTHKAFDWLANCNQMPNRRIGVASLQEKLNYFTSELDLEDPFLQAILTSPTFVDSTGLDWNKRPLSNSMIMQLVAEVGALKKCYQGLCSIGPHFVDVFSLMRDEPGDVPRPYGLEADPEKKVNMSVGIRLGLLDIGQSILTNTIPLAAANNMPVFRLDT